MLLTHTDQLTSERITSDGKYFFWASARSSIDKPKSRTWNIAELAKAYHEPGNGLGDIYYMDLTFVEASRQMVSR